MTAGAQFRAALEAERPLQIAGTINAYTALLAGRAGFKAIYLSGATTRCQYPGYHGRSCGNIPYNVTGFHIDRLKGTRSFVVNQRQRTSPVGLPLYIKSFP